MMAMIRRLASRAVGPAATRPHSRWRHWPAWVGYAAAAWSGVYAVLGVYWSTGGHGFPFGIDNDPAAGVSIMAGAGAEDAAPIIAVISIVGVSVALIMAPGKGRGWLRFILLGYAWTAAVTLALLIPDYRVLVFVAYAPIVLIGSVLGRASEASLADALTWPLVNQFVCIVGGSLWAATAIGYGRPARGACAFCGRTDATSGWTSPSAAARWGGWAVYIAVGIPIVYAVTRLAWALGIPLGITEDFLREGQETGMWKAGAALGTMAVVGAILTIGLIRPWGEVFPRRLPILGGRRVPPALAIVPAGLVSVLVTIAGLMFIRTALFGGFSLGDDLALGLDENWATIAPELLWPIWGLALGAATAAYYFRRRGVCKHCGRGGDDDAAGRALVPDPGRETPRIPRPGP